MFTIQLNEQMLRVISEALGNAPFRVAAPVIAELQKQIDVQQKPSPPTPGNGKTEDALPTRS
jgi:hypothetical protein